MSTPELLALQGVGHSFGGLAVLKAVSLGIPAGAIVGLIGPNGSGKTTLFNIISGYLRPDKGSISFSGRDLSGQSVSERSRAGLVRTFQTPRVFDHLTVIENIMVGACKLTTSGMMADLARTPRSRADLRRMREMAASACSRFGLDAVRHVQAQNLPAGQRRMLEVARAVVSKPALLLLDEPSSGLNETETASLRSALKVLNADGIGILLVSHDMDLMGVAQDVQVLCFGEIIASGDMGAIQRNPQVRNVYLGTEHAAH